MPGEILPGREWYDYEAKYTDGIAKLLIPAPAVPGADRGVPAPGGRDLPGDRRGRALARRLLPRHRRPHLGERDQHDPGVHPLLGVPAALGGERPPLPRARRPPDRARPRAPRPRSGGSPPRRPRGPSRVEEPSAPGRDDAARLSRRPVTVVLAGGGTGGHTAAGLALANALRARLGDGVRLAWIGSQAGIEATWVPAAGIPYHAIPTGKLRRQLAWRNVTDLTLRVPAGFGRALALLGRLRPDVVVATGGFVAVPTAVAAAVRRRPLLVHEQVVVPGAREPADRPARGPRRGDLRRVGLRVPGREGRGHRQPDPPRAPRGPAGPRVRALRRSIPPSRSRTSRAARSAPIA